MAAGVYLLKPCLKPVGVQPFSPGLLSPEACLLPRPFLSFPWFPSFGPGPAPPRAPSGAVPASTPGPVLLSLPRPLINSSSTHLGFRPKHTLLVPPGNASAASSNQNFTHPSRFSPNATLTRKPWLILPALSSSLLEGINSQGFKVCPGLCKIIKQVLAAGHRNEGAENDALRMDTPVSSFNLSHCGSAHGSRHGTLSGRQRHAPPCTNPHPPAEAEK